jgi:VCBS repeat-containing protein
VTFDEDDGTAGNHIPTIVVGAGVASGQNGEAFDHYSLLHSIEGLYGLPGLTSNDKNAADMGFWTASAPPPVNHAPVAASDAFSLDQDTTLTLPAPGVLANDTDADADALTATVATSPSQGTLILNGDGSLAYTPNAQYSGPDSFTYTASDGAATATATVSLTVNASAPPPIQEIVGTKSADELRSTAADETFFGGRSGDTFIFDLSFGHDRITDFQAGSKRHDIITTDAFTSFDDVLQHSKQVGTDTIITHDDANSITLSNVLLSQLRAADFSFVI